MQSVYGLPVDCRGPASEGGPRASPRGATFRFQHKLLYLANAMVDQPIGLEETDDGIWAIYVNTILLATFDERDYILRG